MLHILLGRAKSGRTGIMAKRAGRDIVNGRRAAFIVPDQETFITESRLLTENNFNGLMGTEVLSFNRLCQRIIKWSGRNPGVRLDDTDAHAACRSGYAVRAGTGHFSFKRGSAGVY